MNNKNDSHSTPYWATESFKEFIDYVENLEHILRISTKGISMIRGVPKIVEVLAKAIEDEPPTTYEKRIEIANKEAELAQREVENGFPLLYSQAIVSLWGSLENLIHIFLEKWLMNEPEALLVNQVQKLRVQLGEYESLDSEERPCYILDLLERDIQAPLKQGITRFESLLEIFKL